MTGARILAGAAILALPLSSPALAVAGDSDAGPRTPGTERRDSRGVSQVWVPAGSFLMGTVDTTGLNPPAWARGELASEVPAHRVTLTEGYWIDVHEVTNTAYRQFVEGGGYQDRRWWSESGWKWLASQDAGALPPACVDSAGPMEPRVCVTWHEAEAYARWRGGRLPTEAEWEFAARGPESKIYPWGNAFHDSLVHVAGANRPAPVGGRPGGASWVGAQDMSGNAMEWVSDWLDVRYYERGPIQDPPGPPSGTIKIEKGGWWGGPPFAARAAYRHFEDPPEYRDHHIGFRVVTPADRSN